jgi:hypothetical protein
LAHREELLDRVLLVLWEGEIASEDLDAIAARLVSVEASLGRRAVLVPIVPLGVKIPRGEVRKAALGQIPNLLGHCASIHLVVLGHGVMRDLFRTFARGVFVLSGQYERIALHEALLEAFQAVRAELTASPEHLEARAKKLLKLETS